ncbi:MAG: hypothetical protein VX181_19970, partial [Pseudomonadota bacterium]|nr:hypothetical protein [Pseudomonadota bacterium]
AETRAASQRAARTACRCRARHSRSAASACPGSQVRVQGLRNRSDLNGATGELVQWFDDVGRWRVSMDSDYENVRVQLQPQLKLLRQSIEQEAALRAQLQLEQERGARAERELKQAQPQVESGVDPL